MLFYDRVQAHKTMLAGSQEVLKLRIVALLVWLVGMALFAGLAVYAHATSWSAGEESFLALTTTVAGFGIGRLTGEKSAA